MAKKEKKEKKVPDIETAKKEEASTGLTAVPDSVVRKIEKDEIISLQKEGKLVKYDSRTSMGVVLTKGKDTKWPVDNTIRNDVG